MILGRSSVVRFESSSWTVTLCNLFVVPLQIFLFSVILFLFSLLRPCEIFPLRQDKLIILHESFFFFSRRYVQSKFYSWVVIHYFAPDRVRCVYVLAIPNLRSKRRVFSTVSSRNLRRDLRHFLTLFVVVVVFYVYHIMHTPILHTTKNDVKPNFDLSRAPRSSL